VWGSDAGEDEFAVGFDRDIVVFSMDCKPKCRLMKDIRTKVHEFKYITLNGEEGRTLLLVSTEDGRILFFSTKQEDLIQTTAKKTKKAKKAKEEDDEEEEGLPCAKLIAQLGGTAAGVSGRVKDFTALPVEREDGKQTWYITTGSSDGIVRVWQVRAEELESEEASAAGGQQVGELLGSYATQNRITCVGAFVMVPKPEGAEESEYEFESEEEDEEEDESEEEQ
jgi:protein MAK11